MSSYQLRNGEESCSVCEKRLSEDARSIKMRIEYGGIVYKDTYCSLECFSIGAKMQKRRIMLFDEEYPEPYE